MANLSRTFHRDLPRVRIFNTAGVQIGLSGLGEGENRLTFPAWWKVKEILAAPQAHWIRHATPDEIDEDPKKSWWREYGKEVNVLVHKDRSIADHNHVVGLIGNEVTALATVVDNSCYKEKPCMDLSGISTPPTPPLTP